MLVDESCNGKVGGHTGDHEHKHPEARECASLDGPVGTAEQQEQCKHRAGLQADHGQGEPELESSQTVAETPRHDQDHHSREQLK